MKLLFALALMGNIIIDQVGDTASITNTLGYNPPQEVIIEGINYHSAGGGFMDIMEFTPSTPSGTIDIALNSIPLRIENGIEFFEFMLRLNETGGPNNFAKMEQFEIEVAGMDFFRLAESVLGSGNGSLAYGEGILFSDFGPGNNQADGSIRLPLDIFDGLDSSLIATLRVTLSDIEAGADFVSIDEGRYLGPGPIGDPIIDPNIPEPSRLILVMIGSFLVVLSISRRRKR